MTEREYIIRNGWNKIWLTKIVQEKEKRVFVYQPDQAKAIRFSDLTEARRIAHECRGYLFRLKLNAEPEGVDE